MKRSYLVTFFVTLWVSTAALAATPPSSINYQGVLRDAANTPMDGNSDMIFGFYTDDLGGDQIMLDYHDVANGTPVMISGGLFNVALGTGGAQQDGTGPGTYFRLEDVFRDYGSVWMEIDVGGEILTPRVRVHAAAYAQNASNLEGKSAAEFIDTAGTSQTKSGSLTLGGELHANSVHLPDGAKIFSPGGTATRMVGGDASLDDLELFATSANGDHGSITIRGDDEITFSAGNGRFSFIGGNSLFSATLDYFGNLETAGSLIVGGGSDKDDDTIIFDEVRSLAWRELLGYFEFDAGLATTGILRVGTANEIGNDSVLFDGNKSLQWDEAQSRFEFSNPLAVNGALRLGTNAGTTAAYHFVGPSGSASPDSSAMNSLNDFYVAGDLEAQTYWGDTFESSTGTFNLNGNDNRFNTAGQHRVMIDSDNSTTGNFVGWYHDGVYNTSNQIARMEESGNFKIRGVLSENVAFDIAESFLAAETLEPGDLVRIVTGQTNSVRKTTGMNDRSVIGVVSSRPGILLGSAPFDVDGLRQTWGDTMTEDFLSHLPDLEAALKNLYPEMAGHRDDLVGLALEEYWSQNVAPIALSGRAPVKVDGSNGPIQIGDYLAPGSTPGVAVKATEPGPIIGTALEAFSGTTGTVMTFVHRGHFSGRETVVSPAETTTDTIATAIETVLQPVSEAEPASALTPQSIETQEVGRFSFGPMLEPFVMTGSVETGQALVMATKVEGAVMTASEAADNRVVGIAMEMESGRLPEGQIAVAQAGTVTVLADAGYGPIRVGDAVVTSFTPGHVMRTDDPAPMTMIGKALTPLEFGTGTIRVLLMMR